MRVAYWSVILVVTCFLHVINLSESAERVRQHRSLKELTNKKIASKQSTGDPCDASIPQPCKSSKEKCGVDPTSPIKVPICFSSAKNITMKSLNGKHASKEEYHVINKHPGIYDDAVRLPEEFAFPADSALFLKNPEHLVKSPFVPTNETSSTRTSTSAPKIVDSTSVESGVQIKESTKVFNITTEIPESTTNNDLMATLLVTSSTSATPVIITEAHPPTLEIKRKKTHKALGKYSHGRGLVVKENGTIQAKPSIKPQVPSLPELVETGETCDPELDDPCKEPTDVCIKEDEKHTDYTCNLDENREDTPPVEYRGTLTHTVGTPDGVECLLNSDISEVIFGKLNKTQKEEWVTENEAKICDFSKFQSCTVVQLNTTDSDGENVTVATEDRNYCRCFLDTMIMLEDICYIPAARRHQGQCNISFIPPAGAWDSSKLLPTCVPNAECVSRIEYFGKRCQCHPKFKLNRTAHTCGSPSEFSTNNLYLFFLIVFPFFFIISE